MEEAGVVSSNRNDIDEVSSIWDYQDDEPVSLSFTEAINSEATSKSARMDLSLPEIMDELELAMEEADRQNGAHDQRTKRLQFTELNQLLGSEKGGKKREPDMTETLGMLDLFETFEKDIAAQKTLIAELRSDKANLSLELEERKNQEKETAAKYSKEVKSLEEQISFLEENLQASSFERNEFAAKEAEYVQKLDKLEEKIRKLQRTDVRSSGPEQTVKVSVGELGQTSEEHRKRQEYLESRVAELGFRVREFEAKEAVRPIDKSNAEVSLKQQLNCQSNQLNDLRKELDTIKAKESELVKEKGLAEFRIRELQQELSLSKSPRKKEPISPKPKPKNADDPETRKLKCELANLKSNLKNAETERQNLQQKDVENQKNLKRFRAQVRTLQRILYHKDPSSLPPPIMSTHFKETKVESNTEQHKLERRVLELEAELKSMAYLTRDVPSVSAALHRGEGDVESPRAANQDRLVNELRARLVSQMQLVTCLKENLLVSKAKEGNLLKENELLEFRIRELKEELGLAKTLGKPENELLSDLTETVHSLQSRYFYREKELDHLIRRLSLRNLSTSHFATPGMPLLPTDISTSLYANSQTPLSYLLGTSNDFQTNALLNSGNANTGVLSPTTTVQLLRGSIDEFLLLH